MKLIRTYLRPHRGAPREILPGQKIHASVLFKGNYRAKAKFWKDFDVWPELMYWNDPVSHERLSKLGPLWEKDIFDASTVSTLLKDIQVHNMECFDTVDRLAFMASFGEHPLSNPGHLLSALQNTGGLRLRNLMAGNPN
jgi:hypothetical protein